MSTAIYWFRRDLRIQDNLALTEAMGHHEKVILLYSLDTDIGAAQKWWLHHSLVALQHSLNALGSHLVLVPQLNIEGFEILIQTYAVTAIYWNRRYSEKEMSNDASIKTYFKSKGLTIKSYNGYLLNEPWTIQNQSGSGFKVFTPYWKHCIKTLQLPSLPSIDALKPNPHPPCFDINQAQLLPTKPNWALGFSDYWEPGEKGAHKKLDNFIDNSLRGYATNRDIPPRRATSYLSPHLHFGEIHPARIFQTIQPMHIIPGLEQDMTRFLAELGWREFSYHLLYHYPKLPSENFNPKFNAFPWHQDDAALKAWQRGETGYPIIDAGMRELWHTGYMHNRVRMIAASFLTKDLFIDWRVGAEWFLYTLLDADPANNSASWQWVAGCGADAAPYFRIFNPTLQSEKFDPNGDYIKTWVPELKNLSPKNIHAPWTSSLNIQYPKPIVEHSKARELALTYYKNLQ
jgi:deoxyribodipyrimidine photo-lyase